MDMDKAARRQARLARRMHRRCRQSPAGGMVFGFTIVAAGVLLLLDNLRILYVRDLRSFWPLALVAWGVSKALQSSRPSAILPGSLLAATGALLLLGNLGALTFDLRMAWPLLLIGLGLALLARAVEHTTQELR